jgi:phosphoesterase RecJ-like protein
MLNNNDFQKAVGLIDKSDSILITTHTKPDGDVCGCMAVLGRAFAALGKKTKALMLSPIPRWYAFLFYDKVPILGQDVSLEDLTEGRFGKFDLVVIVDTNSRKQLVEFDGYLKDCDLPVLVMDHHVTSDSLGDVELVEPGAAATGLIVHDLFKYARWPVTKKVAEALFVAVATDTGWFQFANTDSRTLRTCAELIERGADPTELYHALYENYSPQRFALMLSMLGTLQLHFDGRYATQYIRPRDFEQTGAAHADTENFINECHRIDTVKVSALFVELKDGRIRCSLRSRCDADVSKIAVKFGGGGHKMAAGTYLPGSLEDAMQQVSADVKEQL